MKENKKETKKNSSKIKNKLYDFKDRLRDRKMLTLVVSLIVMILILTVYSIYKAKCYRLLLENTYNEAFYELTEEVNTTEKLLKKAMITNNKEHATIIFSSISKTATMAQSNLSKIPIEVNNLENTNKFFSQVNDYSYYLTKKCASDIGLSDEDMNNIKNLYGYSIELKDTLNQLNEDLFSNTIRWGELSKKGNKSLKSDDSNLSQTTFSNIEEDMHQYAGLIYDGAYSESQLNFKGTGLKENEVSNEEAKENAKKFIGEDRIEEINDNGESQDARIKCYNFTAKLKNGDTLTISISKKGGQTIEMNCDRNVMESSIDEKTAVENGKEFLKNREMNNMREVYYLRENNILTINYAYYQEYNGKEVIMYPDLVKVKVALDNGEVLGIEASHYLNSHQEKRNLSEIKIKEEEALKLVNSNLEIKGVDLAVIPTEWNTEILCYEIKGTIKKSDIKETNENSNNDKNNEENNSDEENDFLVYINAENGKEEDILMIINTENGTLVS